MKRTAFSWIITTFVLLTFFYMALGDNITPDRFSIGDHVVATGEGYNNPEIQTKSLRTPHIGEELILAPDDEGVFRWGQYYRGCTPFGCGWYPSDALKLIEHAPTVVPKIAK